MTRTQVQLPDELYAATKELAARMEVSLAEIVRRGLEYMIAVSPGGKRPKDQWQLPVARHLGGNDPFAYPDWRERVHTGQLKVAEEDQAYEVGEDSK